MKKILVILAALTISVSAFSQSYKNAIGLRLGYEFSVTYKSFLSEENFLEFGVNLHPFDTYNHFGVNVYGFYEWNFNIGGVDGLTWYVGPGLSLGYRNGFTASVNCMIGIEYKFPSIPLALSLDYAPGIRYYGGYEHPFGYAEYLGGIGVKYTF